MNKTHKKKRTKKLRRMEPNSYEQPDTNTIQQRKLFNTSGICEQYSSNRTRSWVANESCHAELFNI